MSGSGRDVEKADDLKRVYAAAPADEPPSALDERILAEARRVAESGGAQGRGGDRQGRWGPPLAAAAVLVLGVLVVFQMQVERPARDGAAMEASGKHSEDAIALATPPQGGGASGAVPSEQAAFASPADGAGPALPVPQRSDSLIVADVADIPKTSRDPGADSAQAALLAGRERPTARPERPMAPRSLAPAASPLSPATEPAIGKLDESPEGWLRRLAELKQQGRAKEFDEGLAEFRKHHPGYRIPEALLAPR